MTYWQANEMTCYILLYILKYIFQLFINKKVLLHKKSKKVTNVLRNKKNMSNKQMNLVWFLMSCLTSGEIISDSLIPYLSGGHTDRTRNHRYVRDCQRNKYGNSTYEFIKPVATESTFETKYIAYYLQTLKRLEFGHRTVIRNPLKMISVLEPLKSGSCKTKTLAYVQESAKQQSCQVAVNAGFFNPNEGTSDYGTCLGNIISNGHLVQDNGGIQNAHFGIRSDGTVVIGYLSEMEVKNKQNPFVQLLSGVGWILRNGESYLNESEIAECKDTETTGSLKSFFSVKSARTMIGYDANGYVHIVQFDGKTHDRGLTLYEAVDYLKSIGLTNAINFDGGGSATYVQDSTIINYPSNICTLNKDELCPKPVSTIICVYNDKSPTTGSISSISYCCNRNYILVITLSCVIAVCLLAIVFLCSVSSAYRHRVKDLTSGQRDALKNLLDRNAYSSDADSENEGL